MEPSPNIDSLLSRMSIVLAPSLWLEAWGMVVTEAMLRGLPVVVSDAGASQLTADGPQLTGPLVMVRKELIKLWLM